MVFRIQYQAVFATAAARTASRSTLASAVSGRDVSVVADVNEVSRAGRPSIRWEATSNSTGDAGTVYALLQVQTAPLAGSFVRHHTCFHGDNDSRCVPTAQKVW